MIDYTTIDAKMIAECEESTETEMSLESLYHQTNGIVQETQSSFQKLESCSDSQAEYLEREIQARIDTIIR